MNHYALYDALAAERMHALRETQRGQRFIAVALLTFILGLLMVGVAIVITSL